MNGITRAINKHFPGNWENLQERNLFTVQKLEAYLEVRLCPKPCSKCLKIHLCSAELWYRCRACKYRCKPSEEGMQRCYSCCWRPWFREMPSAKGIRGDAQILPLKTARAVDPSSPGSFSLLVPRSCSEAGLVRFTAAVVEGSWDSSSRHVLQCTIRPCRELKQCSQGGLICFFRSASCL